MWKKLNALLLSATTLALSACAHGSTAPVIVSEYCEIAGPITLDSEVDSPETIAAIEKHNSKWACVCENDCPAEPVAPEKPSATNPIP